MFRRALRLFAAPALLAGVALTAVNGADHGSKKQAWAQEPGPVDTWSPAGNLDSDECKAAGPQALESSCEGRRRPLSTVLSNGQVLVVGGHGVSVSRSAQIFDPTTGRWRPTAQMTRSHDNTESALIALRGRHCADKCGWALVAGGSGNFGNGAGTAELFNPEGAGGIGSWEPAGELFSDPGGNPTQATVVLKGPGCADKCGWVLLPGGPLSPHSQLYDPGRNVWERTLPMMQWRNGYSATLLDDGRVIAAGGTSLRESVVGDPKNRGTKTDRASFSSEIYDPKDGTWIPSGELKFGRMSHVATLLDGPNCAPHCNKVLIAGGHDNYPWQAGGIDKRAELFDPNTGNWEWAGEMKRERSGNYGPAPAALLPDGTFLVVGSENHWDRNNIGVKTAEIYDPSDGLAGSWRETPPLINIRRDSAGALLPSGPAKLCDPNCGKFLVAGGRDNLDDDPDEEAVPTSEFYTPLPATPEVVSMSPNQGPAAGGTEVTLKGFGLGLATSVTFEGEPPVACGQEGADRCWVDLDEPDRTMYVTTPPHLQGGPVKVTVDVRTEGLPDAVAPEPFTYLADLPIPKPQLNSVSPNCGPMSGGTDVSLVGANLGAASEVRFGDVSLGPEQFAVASDTKITAVSPPHPEGTVAIKVRTPGGIAEGLSSVGKFTYPCPVVLPTRAPDEGPPAGPEVETVSQPPKAPAPPSGTANNPAPVGEAAPAGPPPPASGGGAPAVLGSQAPQAAGVSQQSPFFQPSNVPVVAPALGVASPEAARPAPRYSMTGWQPAAPAGAASFVLGLFLYLSAPSRRPAVVASGSCASTAGRPGGAAKCRIAL